MTITGSVLTTGSLFIRDWTYAANFFWNWYDLSFEQCASCRKRARGL